MGGDGGEGGGGERREGVEKRKEERGEGSLYMLI